MKKSLIILFLIGIFLFSFNFVNAGTTNVTECGVLNITSETYELNTSLTSSFDCLTINATNITLDCNNYNISFGNGTGGFGIVVSGDGGGTGFDNVTIRNCYLIQNESGVNESAIFFGPDSENAIVYNNTIETYGNETVGIMLESNSVNANISSNNIYTNGTFAASGIEIADNGFNAIIENNLILTLGDDSSGIFLMDNVSEIVIYNNLLWVMGNRTISDHAMGGVVLDQGTYDLNISSNIILTGWLESLAGAYEYDDDESWILNGSGYDTAGIWIWGDNSTIDNNIIISFGELGDGIFVNDVEGINITSNFIATFGEQGHGIHSESSENFSLLFYENIIGTFGNNASGIYLDQDSYNNISSNNISTLGNYSYGVVFNQSSNITFMGNIIETGESNSYVLYANVSAGNLIYNNIFNTSTNGSGVFINNSDPNDFNITKTSGINIVGKSYLGGNYWTNISGTGYSDTCTEATGDYICDSSYRIIEGNDFIDYLPLALTTSYTAPTSPSGRSGGYSSFYPNESQLSEGYNKVMYKNWKISFKLENESHIFKVVSINTTNVKITLSSEIQEATFSIGEEKKFELTGDGIFDVLIKLNSIISNKANFTIQTISESILDSSGNETVGVGDKESNSYLLLILILIVLAIIVILYKKYKKSGHWKIGKKK